MVKKIKRFVIFMLFSLFFQLFHLKTSDETNEGQKFIPQLGASSAEAKCCPVGTKKLDSNGNCCMSDDCY